MTRPASLLLLLTLSFCGCLVQSDGRKPTPPDDKKPTPTPILKSLSAPAVFAALADDIDAGYLSSSTRLAQIVVVLNRENKLEAEPFAAFGAAFPDLATERPLTPSDATTLRSLK